MKQAEIFSLLSLPCFRFEGEKFSFGRLECQENQVRFVERDRIFSISFYKIENIELRNVEEQPQLIFLTHVGLIIFYFYENTPLSHIRYIHDAILGAFIAYKEQRYIHSIWSGSLSTWNQKSILISVYNSKIVLQSEKETHTHSKESIQKWKFTKYTLTLQHNEQKLTLRGADLHILQSLTKAMLDGSIQGLWNSTGLFKLTRQYIIISEKYLYIHSASWNKKSVNQIELCHIHTVKHTSKGIEFESLTNPTSIFVLSTNLTHVFHNICNVIVKHKHPDYVFFWRRRKILRGTLIETPQNLIIETHHEMFQWSWDSLCRDDDEESQPQSLALRNEEESIRIHL
ncbi:MAG: hypothetical protein CL916_03255, partial [Deltaproteobacteria bacterium]|nr:hypothetical protein [Deltaproteobacteria bacterium]